MLDSQFMDTISPGERQALIIAIAAREGTAREISLQYDKPIAWLRRFVEENKEELKLARQALEADEGREVTPTELQALWITNKGERLARYEQVANALFQEALNNPTDSTVLREFRSYLAAAANELGQLLHRGSGEAGMGDTVSYDIQGVDLDNLR
jgi:hypothetical protein